MHVFVWEVCLLYVCIYAYELVNCVCMCLCVYKYRRDLSMYLCIYEYGRDACLCMFAYRQINVFIHAYMRMGL